MTLNANEIAEMLRTEKPLGSGTCPGCGDDPVAIWGLKCINCWKEEIADQLHVCDDDCRSDGCQFRQSDDYEQLVNMTYGDFLQGHYEFS